MAGWPSRELEHRGRENSARRAPYVSICAPGQAGCLGWPATPVLQLSPEFSDGNEKGPREWTNIQACANTYGNNTSQWNATWNNMSIVSSSSTPQQFSYPYTAMEGWLCGTTSNGSPMNNSSSQGEIFYQQINNTVQNYKVNAIWQCPSDEGVYEPGAVTFDGTSGLTAIELDMVLHNVHHH